jgi:hypothetical protein
MIDVGTFVQYVWTSIDADEDAMPRKLIGKQCDTLDFLQVYWNKFIVPSSPPDLTSLFNVSGAIVGRIISP